MTAGGFLCYTKDVFCLFISIEIRRGGERRGASSMGAIKQKKPPGTITPILIEHGINYIVYPFATKEITLFEMSFFPESQSFDKSDRGGVSWINRCYNTMYL